MELATNTKLVHRCVREDSKKIPDYLVTLIKKVGRYLAEITIS